MENKNIIAPSEQEMERLKRQYPRSYTIVLSTDEEEYHFVVKPVDRSVLSAAMQIGKDDSIASAHVLASNAIVWGDVSLLEDASFLMAFADQQEKIITSVTATLKKN